MKKLLSIFLAAMLALSLVACGGKETSNSESDSEQVSVNSALELLTTVWNSYTDDEKFPVMGGDMSDENMMADAPGKFGIDDTNALDTTLGFPASSGEQIDDAASLIHMLNANTFTCGAFHVKNQSDSAGLTAAIKDNIMQRQWLCGFPDKLVIMKIDSYVVSFFGTTDLVDTFKTKLAAAYPSAETICDEPIV